MRTAIGWRGMVVVVAYVLSAGVAARAADASPDDIVKYRKAVMKSQREHLAAATAIIQGKVPYAKHLGDHVKSLEASTAIATELFPEGSDAGDTGALSAVWTEKSDFQKRAKDTQQYASALAKTVAAGDTGHYAARLKDLQESCKSCHKDFRKELK